MMKSQNIKSDQDNKAAVNSMFDSIAHNYDFLNHFLSFGIDRVWRKKAIRNISGTYNNPLILDVATGTADLSITAIKLDPEHITGIDISIKMLELGREKISRKGLSDRIDLIRADSENMPFDDNSFDIAMVAFGVRNFANPLKGLSEMRRVVRTGGVVMVLEFSKPVKFPFKQLYYFYFLKILPLIAGIFSKNSGAYRYLPESVMHFPDNERFIELMRSAGLSGIKQQKLTGGIASIYTGLKS
jgi:demethylmenaquinone methyltransferase / 2-methoxy-6-polyprenyl-1,4-benzoquinol methylase